MVMGMAEVMHDRRVVLLPNLCRMIDSVIYISFT